MEEKKEHVLTEGTLEEIQAKLASAQGIEKQPEPLPETEPQEKIKPAGDKPPDKPAEPQPQTWDKVKWANERFGQQIEKEEDADTFFETLKERNSKFDELHNVSEQLRLENEELKLGVDPMQFFANDKVFIYNEMIKKFPDYDPGIVSQIAFADIAEMSPMQVLTYQALLNDPKHEVYDDDNEAAADIENTWVEKGYDPDKPFAEQEPKVKTALKRARKEAVDQFNKLKSEIKLPERVDVVKAKADKDKLAQEKYDRLNPVIKSDIKRVEDSLKTLEFFETTKGADGKDQRKPIYAFDLANFSESAKVKKELSTAIDFLSKTASEWEKTTADQAKTIIAEKLLKDYLWEHKDQIMLAALQTERAKWSEEERLKNDNPSPANTNQRPGASTSKRDTIIAKAKSDFDEGVLGKQPQKTI